MKIELEKTQDGWNTLYLPEENEHYHSTFGAYQESEWIYINRGISYILSQERFKNKKDPIRILEMGFGTGLNTILSLLFCSKENQKVEYTTVEAYPLSPSVVSELDYSTKLLSIPLCNKIDVEYYKMMHDAQWGQTKSSFKEINSYFSFKKINSLFEDLTWEKDSFDLVYYDAFSPKVQPQLWTLPIFQKMYESIKINGCLVTYCAQGQLKKNLKEAGFFVEALEGPPGKREITRALKK